MDPERQQVRYMNRTIIAMVLAYRHENDEEYRALVGVVQQEPFESFLGPVIGLIDGFTTGLAQCYDTDTDTVLLRFLENMTAEEAAEAEGPESL